MASPECASCLPALARGACTSGKALINRALTTSTLDQLVSPSREAPTPDRIDRGQQRPLL